mmetsp:Transcript_75407/g.149137  ORF Transcript_75407/g.149137 Transcript_75407/m.149137 type:complete len:235 (+) Transcript_75407:1254-1958(+)
MVPSVGAHCKTKVDEREIRPQGALSASQLQSTRFSEVHQYVVRRDVTVEGYGLQCSKDASQLRDKFPRKCACTNERHGVHSASRQLATDNLTNVDTFVLFVVYAVEPLIEHNPWHKRHCKVDNATSLASWVRGGAVRNVLRNAVVRNGRQLTPEASQQLSLKNGHVKVLLGTRVHDLHCHKATVGTINFVKRSPYNAEGALTDHLLEDEMPVANLHFRSRCHISVKAVAPIFLC